MRGFMSSLAGQNRYYTYEEYLAMEYDGKRYEYMDGDIYAMASPSATHGDISGELFRQLANFLRGKACKVYQSSLDVKLNIFDKIIGVVPDIMVVCDKSKIVNDKFYNGAPDFIIEILSFSSPQVTKHDTDTKLKWYRIAGVKEYWIVNHILKTVQVYILENGKYIFNSYNDEDIIPVHTLEGCEINLAEVFHDITVEESIINQNIIDALKAVGVSDDKISEAIKNLENN